MAEAFHRAPTTRGYRQFHGVGACLRKSPLRAIVVGLRWIPPRMRDARDVEEVVRAAIASEQPLEIIGHGSSARSASRWRPTRCSICPALNAVIFLRAERADHHGRRRARRLRDVQSLIDAKNQQFAFEPVDTALLLGHARRSAPSAA